MGQVFSRVFRVRYHECDAYGHVNNTYYLRYLGETALRANAAAGYDPERSMALGHIWKPHLTDIEYLQPLRYGMDVRVDSRVTGLAGAALRRAFEFRVEGSGELAARAQTEMLLTQPTTGEAVAIPQDLAAGLCPRGSAAGLPAWDPFPASPPPPPGVYKLRRRVAWQDLDVARQIDPARYLDFVEEASFGVIEAHGWPARRMVAAGFAILLRRHQIQYLAPACLDDELEVATWASNIKRATATRHYTISRLTGNQLLARVDTLGVWVELATGRPIRIPAGFMDDFTPNLVYQEKP